MEILYKVHNNLYVNLTNKCPCACTFCLRQNMDHVGESKSLWLEREPSAEEVIAEFAKFDMSRFNEVVFCGFGEPTEAFEVLKKVAAFVKETYHMPIRLNTNGLGNLVNGRDITPEMEGLIDTVSISLNTPNADRYHELVRSKFGDKSFDAMLDFARSSTKYVSNVVMTTVDTTITKEEEEECRRICDSIGAKYRIRPWED
ncbi:molybdenum cofactor biosynthesis protein A [uncultured Coprococcus sp.]|jgi:radical SAM enzyme (TIGR04100 family)|uniref:TIGR04100 family radical SAM protein n=1 Tax=Coprococcus ammoniilyticus TaxID=2981785 RepID=UPI0003399389|nr:TIGR04100 family radical SAM protein [Coprococcus ammoniilyticus]MCU6730920.1 TIGR04100 family radical SAM protein [Coprococcus ammoniilyticus]CCY61455.1 radical SAM protein TatD family-associated [Clostridium sp. CAG:264]SCH85514.1 molybdenum cofactor biosynthesis protein A [uncultured Coprococcus sp.]